MGGPGVELFRFKDDHSPVYDHDAPEKIDTPEARRRAVYRFAVRSVPNPLLDCLDAADPNVNTPVRNTTITALQALALLNDAFVIQQAGHFAERLRTMSDDPRRQIEAAYALAFGRPPRPTSGTRWPSTREARPGQCLPADVQYERVLFRGLIAHEATPATSPGLPDRGAWAGRSSVTGRPRPRRTGRGYRRRAGTIRGTRGRHVRRALWGRGGVGFV
jgi:hypothetical protein